MLPGGVALAQTGGGAGPCGTVFRAGELRAPLIESGGISLTLRHGGRLSLAVSSPALSTSLLPSGRSLHVPVARKSQCQELP